MKLNPKYLIAIPIVILVSSLIYYLSDIVTYILLAWVISMIGAPVVVFLRKYIGKNAAAIVTLALFVLSFLFLIWIFVPPLVNQVENLSKIDLDKVVYALEEPIKDWEKWLIDKKLMLAPDSITYDESTQNKDHENNMISHYISLDSNFVQNGEDSVVAHHYNVFVNVKLESENILSKQKIPEDNKQDFFVILKQTVTSYLNPSKIQSIFDSTINAFGNVVVGVFSIFFIGFFFLREQGLFDHILTSIVPLKYEQQTKQAVDETSKLLIRYFIGILFQVILITLMVSLALASLGVKNALLIGFFAALMNVIPYVGPIIGAGFAIMITLSSNLELPFYTEMIPLLTKVILVFGAMQLIDNVLLQPNIFSKSVKAHPLEIFIVVLIGAKISGMLGMVLAIPFYTAFRVIGKVFLSEFKVIQKLTRNM